MRHLPSVLLSILFLVSCSGEPENVPEGNFLSYRCQMIDARNQSLTYEMFVQDSLVCARVTQEACGQSHICEKFYASKVPFNKVRYMLDKAEAQKWKRRYDAIITDGTQWNVALQWTDGNVYSGGSNAWPRENPIPEINSLIRNYSKFYELDIQQ